MLTTIAFIQLEEKRTLIRIKKNSVFFVSPREENLEMNLHKYA